MTRRVRNEGASTWREHAGDRDSRRTALARRICGDGGQESSPRPGFEPQFGWEDLAKSLAGNRKHARRRTPEKVGFVGDLADVAEILAHRASALASALARTLLNIAVTWRAKSSSAC